MRGDPLKFTTFVLGAFVFVYYIGFAIQLVRVWRNVGRCPVVAFSEGGSDNWLAAIGALLSPLPFLAWAWNPRLFLSFAVPAMQNWPLRLLGLLFLCAGGSTCYLSILEMGDSWRVGIERQSKPQLVQSGIYGSIRHPIYSSAILTLFGVFLMAPNWVFAAAWVCITIAVAVQAPREERFLQEFFGSSYSEYTSKTGRFIP